jgi:hypothetical protein
MFDKLFVVINNMRVVTIFALLLCAVTFAHAQGKYEDCKSIGTFSDSVLLFYLTPTGGLETAKNGVIDKVRAAGGNRVSWKRFSIYGYPKADGEGYVCRATNTIFFNEIGAAFLQEIIQAYENATASNVSQVEVFTQLDKKRQALYPNDAPLRDYFLELGRVTSAMQERVITPEDAATAVNSKAREIELDEAFTRDYEVVVQAQLDIPVQTNSTSGSSPSNSEALAIGASLLSGQRFAPVQQPTYLPVPSPSYQAPSYPVRSFSSSSPQPIAIQPRSIAPSLPVVPRPSYTNCFIDSGGFYHCSTTR